MSWVSFKRVLLEELYDAASKLEGQTASHILVEIIFKVADMVEALERWCQSGLDRQGDPENPEGNRPSQAYSNWKLLKA